MCRTHCKAQLGWVVSICICFLFLPFYWLFWDTGFFTPLFPESWVREAGAPGNGRGVRSAESLLPWHTHPEWCYRAGLGALVLLIIEYSALWYWIRSSVFWLGSCSQALIKSLKPRKYSYVLDAWRIILFVPSQNHTMVWVIRDFKYYVVQLPPHLAHP